MQETVNFEEWPALDDDEAYRVKKLLWMTFPRVMVSDVKDLPFFEIVDGGTYCLIIYYFVGMNYQFITAHYFPQ